MRSCFQSVTSWPTLRGWPFFYVRRLASPSGLAFFLASRAEASSLAAVRGTQLLSARLTQDPPETSSLAAVRVRAAPNTFLHVDLCAWKINI